MAHPLEIPKLLRRKPMAPPPAAPPPPPPPARQAPVSPDPRFPAVFRVYLPDLHPNARKDHGFGCGLRWVMAKLGYRWVYFKPFFNHAEFRRYKLARERWEALGAVRLDAGGLLQAEAEDDRDPEPASAPAAGGAPAPKAKAAKAGAAQPAARGYWHEATAMAGQGKVPPPPDFSAETHKRYRPRLADVAALAAAGNRAALEAWTIKASSSSPKAILRYRDLCLIALSKK